MSKFLNKKYEKLEAYTPGEQPKDKKYIKLNTNESPYPPAPNVIEAITKGEVEDLRLYPDPECTELKKALANVFGVEKKNIFVSNGSDDILNFAFMAFSENGVVFPEISYGFYKVFAELHGIDYEAIPLQSDFSINIEDYYNKGKMVVIANPNAPTGLLLSLTEIEKILKENKENVVLIDEAYIDFGGVSSASLARKYDNLLVVQTFSKSRSLAGGRLGFAIANEKIIEDLEKIKYSTNPYSINRLSLIAGYEAVKALDYYNENCDKIIKAREYAKAELKKLGFYVTDSFANFVFAKHESLSGEHIYEKLREKGILVRHFGNEKICDFNRITIGTMEETEKLIIALDEILRGKVEK